MQLTCRVRDVCPAPRTGRLEGPFAAGTGPPVSDFLCGLLPHTSDRAGHADRVGVGLVEHRGAVCAIQRAGAGLPDAWDAGEIRDRSALPDGVDSGDARNIELAAVARV